MTDPARRVVLVTGGGRNIGRAIALAFAAAGDDLVLAARTMSDLEDTATAARTLGARALVVVTDVTDTEQVTAMTASAIAHFGRIDVVVGNSGVPGPAAPLWEVGPAEWRRTIEVNTTGTFLVFRSVLPSMIARGSGCLIAVAAMTGKRPLWGRTPYAASKTALTGLVRTLAVEAGPHGIRVNLVSPGWVDGPRMEWVAERQAERRGVSIEQVRAELASDAPLGRTTSAADVADACVFLASERASMITGVDLDVNGGVAMW